MLLPSSSRTACTIAAAVALTAVAPAAASAASLSFDRSCQVQTGRVTATVNGFSPDSSVRLGSTNDYGSGIEEVITTDAAGNGSVTFTAPPAQLETPGFRNIPVTATDADPAIVATGAFKTSTGSFLVSGRDRPSLAKRTWTISGFEGGQAIYGHFVHRGKLRGTYRFGVASGDCGQLTVQAAAIPIALRATKPKGRRGSKAKVRVPAGEWTVQLDQSAAYVKTTPLRMVGTLTVSDAGRT